MYNKEDRAVANDRYRAVMNQLLKLDREVEFEAQIVPEDIEIRLVNGNGECVLIPTKN